MGNELWDRHRDRLDVLVLPLLWIADLSASPGHDCALPVHGVRSEESLPNDLNGFRFESGLFKERATRSRTKVLLLNTYDDRYLYRALQAGASGFLLKSMPTEELLGAIRIAARGEALIAPSVTRRLVRKLAAGIAPPTQAPGLERLTTREHEILLWLGKGAANAEIAQALHISDKTVKSHVSRILAKLCLRDRMQAVVYVYQNGLAE
jgi:DNA-binding NarL/FixJ family response regulator